MSEYISIPLDIEGVRINRVLSTDNGEIHIHVSSAVEGARCHRCGRAIAEGYDYGREIKLRHLSIFDKPTYILIRPRRYICRMCDGNPVTTQVLSWYEPRQAVTKAYADHLLKCLINGTVSDVSRKEKIGCDELEDLLAERFGESVDWTKFARLPTLGVDELALKKGHRDFVTIMSVRMDNGETRLLAILKNREKSTVKEFFLSIPKGLRDTVRTVCSDLYEGYTEAAREAFGDDVAIVADRFHVAKLYRDDMDAVRKREMRRLKHDLAEEEYREFKGAMWLVRKNPKSLGDEEKNRLRHLLEQAPALLLTYVFAWALAEIFDAPYSKPEAESRLRAWTRLVEERHVEGFERFVKTLEAKMDLITNYFIRRENSGFVEGLNHKIRVLLGRCYGVFNRIRLFQRLSLDLDGYEMFA